MVKRPLLRGGRELAWSGRKSLGWAFADAVPRVRLAIRDRGISAHERCSHCSSGCAFWDTHRGAERQLGRGVCRLPAGILCAPWPAIGIVRETSIDGDKAEL